MGDSASIGPNKGHYEWDLDIQVETCIQEYEEDLEAWWVAGGPTDPELSRVLLDQAKRFADTVLEATEELVPIEQGECALVEPQFKKFVREHEERFKRLSAEIEQKDLPPGLVRKAVRDVLTAIRPDEGTSLKVAWDFLLARCMGESVGRSRKAATRLLLLASLRVPSNPTKVTRSFLRQAADCFVWGFDVPCIVFCRSTIDVALKDAGFDKRGLKGRMRLEERIKKAAASHLLDADGKSYAMEVKKLGDDAVHGKPLAMGDVLEVVRKTLLVLQQITQAKPG